MITTTPTDAFLTVKQKQVLDYIETFQQVNKASPSLSEIARDIGMSSPAHARNFVIALHLKGYIQKEPDGRISYRKRR